MGSIPLYSNVPLPYIRRMKLREYLQRHKMTATEFGKRIGRSHAVVSRLCHGKSLPSLALMVRIEQETNGTVTAKDFLSQTEEIEGEAA